LRRSAACERQYSAAHGTALASAMRLRLVVDAHRSVTAGAGVVRTVQARRAHCLVTSALTTASNRVQPAFTARCHWLAGTTPTCRQRGSMCPTLRRSCRRDTARAHSLPPGRRS